MRQHVMSASRGFCRWSILQLPHIREYGTRLSRLGYDVCIRTLCINAVVLLCINQFSALVVSGWGDAKVRYAVRR